MICSFPVGWPGNGRPGRMTAGFVRDVCHIDRDPFVMVMTEREEGM
jgi:hypothetical protein